jgi:hypothetical protein
MFGILIDKIFAMLGGYVCQHTVCIPTGINCVFLDDMFLFSYKTVASEENLKEANLVN